jgi:phosphoribosyl 1,2-cyclic phosphodiesterase
MTEIIFLGTCGGRFATIYQSRSTGGIYIQDTINLAIDPGPGALLRMREEGIDPTKTDVLLVSHCHPDHYTDTDILIEAMTMGGTVRRGTMIGSKSVISGIEGFDPKASSYHQSRLAEIHAAMPGDELQVGGLRITTTPTRHTDPSGIGFRLHTKNGIITYSGDTSVNPEVVDSYMDTRLLILALTTPPGIQLPHHLSPDDAVGILKKVRPELVLLTHFGLRAVKAGTENLASFIKDRSGVVTRDARDGMRVIMEEDISIK